jgi:hypothetical protein
MRKALNWLLGILLLFIAMTNQVLAQAEKEELKKGLLSFGGQVRLRFDATQNQSLEDFSYTPDKSETQLLNRTRLHVEASPADWVRIYFEPQFYGRWGGYNNEDRLSVYQGYVEFPRLGQLPISARVGRQDFVYGSAFFLGNDDFYRGLTWDGAKINVQPMCNLSVDLIAARLVSFTNNKAGKTGLYGFYSTYSGLKDTAWDFYFFYNRHGFQNLYNHLHETLHDSPLWFTVGTRLEAKPVNRLTIEIEPMYQFGRVRYTDPGEDGQIRAYGGHFDLSYDFALPLEPSLRVGYAFGTGDRSPQSGVMREFHGNVYNDTLVVGDTSLVPDVSGIDIGDIRASGMEVVTLSSSFKLSPMFSLCLDWHHFTADKVPQGFTRTIGCEADLFLTCELSEKISIIASANRFFTADIFRQATGKNIDVDYFYLQTQIEF